MGGCHTFHSVDVLTSQVPGRWFGPFGNTILLANKATDLVAANALRN